MVYHQVINGVWWMCYRNLKFAGLGVKQWYAVSYLSWRSLYDNLILHYAGYVIFIFNVFSANEMDWLGENAL